MKTRALILLPVLAVAELSACRPAGVSVSLDEIELAAPTPLPGEFTAISGLLELSPTTVLVSDGNEGELRLVDFSRMTVRVVGRSGRGPQEYRRPGRVFRWGDSILLHDRGNQRLAVLDDSLHFVRTVRLTGDTLLAGVQRGVDREGRVYVEWEQRGSRLGSPDGDSIPVMRWDPRRNEVREAFRVDGTDWVTRVFQEGTTRSVFRWVHPFSLADEWAVSSDEVILVVRAQPLHVEVRELDGTLRRRTPPIPYPAVPTTERDGETVDSAVGEVVIPEFKPPIVDGSAVASNDGYVWVQLHTPAGSDSNAYLVVRSTGDVVGIARTPAQTRLVGLGRAAVYVAVEDEVGLLRLSRYRVRYP